MVTARSVFARSVFARSVFARFRTTCQGAMLLAVVATDRLIAARALKDGSLVIEIGVAGTLSPNRAMTAVALQCTETFTRTELSAS